jgi:hypothetical protein
MDIDKLIANYAGLDYAKPRCLEVASISFDDYSTIEELIEGLTTFKSEHASATIKPEERETDYSSCVVGFMAVRAETEDETAARIEGYKQQVLEQQAQRRSQYERMKREFGDA